MRPLRVPDTPTLRDALREELHHSAHARYLNRLQCLLLVACGHTCYEVAKCFGESPRSVERWIHRYEEQSLDGLKDHPRTSRGSRKLTLPILRALERDLQSSPNELGYREQRWTGRLVAIHLEREYRVQLSPRHCSRILHQLRDTEAGGIRQNVWPLKALTVSRERL